MTKEEIIEMVKQTQFFTMITIQANGEAMYTFDINALQSFAKLVGEKEREECAKIADEWSVAYPHPSKAIAETIRARGQE